MDRIVAGETFDALRSADGRFTFAYQGDGNLVLYGPMGPLWQSQTAGSSPGYAVLQGDGNLVVYDADDRPVWASMTDGHPEASLVVQGDGNVVIYALDAPLWSTDTVYIEQAGADFPRPSPAPAQPPPPVWNPPPGGGGLVESASSHVIRPRLTRAQIAAFLPTRGAFRFPAPYTARGARLTNASDGSVRPVGMAYWPILNNATGRGELLAFVSLDDVLTLFAIDKNTLAVSRIGSLPFHTTGEFCYWSFEDADVLYVPDGTRLFRYNVRSHQIEVAVEAPSEIRQCHSSRDGRVHSMTLDGGPAVFRNGRIERFRAQGDYDECQVDKSGEWLLSKEAGPDGETGNRIIHLASGREWYLTKRACAVGHSDMGWGYVVGEDNQTDPGGVFRLWLFTENGPINGGVMYASSWASMTRYVSHCNAIRSRPEFHDVLFSSAHPGEEPRANELVLARLDGSQQCRIVCPNLTDLSVGPQDPDSTYWRKTRACLDPTGTYAAWSANCGTDRSDVFVAELP